MIALTIISIVSILLNIILIKKNLLIKEELLFAKKIILKLKILSTNGIYANLKDSFRSNFTVSNNIAFAHLRKREGGKKITVKYDSELYGKLKDSEYINFNALKTIDINDKMYNNYLKLQNSIIIE